jgi:hypothetical protein
MRYPLALTAGLTLAALAAPVPAAPAPDRFGWPVEGPRSLAATFAETRSASLHAGIDVRTGGRTGLPVRAQADGSVVRLRTSPWGYGRVVYLQLADGTSLVYAHLQAFAPRLAARVHAAQRARNRYTVDVALAPGEITVKRGEVVAWSGDSGTGPAHLHVELRDRDNRPINPLRHGFVVADASAPHLERIALVPSGAASRVDGSHEPLVLTVADGTWPTVPVEGHIGVAVQAVDYGDQAPNRLAPYALGLTVDAASVLRVAYDTFGYDQTHLMPLDRLTVPVADGVAEFLLLFRRPGNRLAFYQGTSGDGWLGAGRGTPGWPLSPGLHQLEVEAFDVAGNRAAAAGHLMVDAAPAIAGLELLDGGRALAAQVTDDDDRVLRCAISRRVDGQWQAVSETRIEPGPQQWALPAEPASLWRVWVEDGRGRATWAAVGEPAPPAPAGASSGPLRLAVVPRFFADFVELRVQSDRVLARAPDIHLEAQPVPARQQELQEYRADLRLVPTGPATVRVRVRARGLDGQEGEAEVALNQIPAVPGQGTRLRFGTPAAELVFAADSPCRLFFPQYEAVPVTAPEYLAEVGPGHSFAPADEAFDARVEVRLPYPPDYAEPQRLGVYLQTPSGWSMVGNDLDPTAGQVVARVRRLGRFAVLADREPPRIAQLVPAPGATVGNRRPRLSAAVSDRGSGLASEDDIVVELDGTRLISEYDPDGARVQSQPEQALRPGRHVVVFRVTDQSGQTTTSESAFRVR